MTINFACPKCGRPIRVKDEVAGKSGQCHSCGTSLRVPSVGELIPAPPPVIKAERVSPPAVRRPRQPADLITEDDFEIAPQPMTQQHYAPPAYQPPPIVVNVVQHSTANAHAQATAVAVASRPYTNGLATAALVLAVLSLLGSWIPFVGTLAMFGATLALVLAFLGFIVSVFSGGRGFATSLAAGVVGGIAVMVGAASTAMTTAAVGTAAAIANHDEHTRAAPQAPKAPATVERRPASVPDLRARSRPKVASVNVRDPAPAKDEPFDAEAAARKRFGGVLSNGKALAKAGVYGSAERTFRCIIKEAPGTQIAADAQKELDSLPAH